MSSIAGVVHLDGSRPDAGDVEAMLAAMAHRAPDGVRIAEMPGAVFGFGLMATVPEANREALPVGNRLLVTADGRIDNRSDLLLELGLVTDTPDGDVLHAAIERWGPQAADRVIGDFAWAAWRPDRRRLLLARDYLGLRPLFYHRGAGRVAFASSLEGLLCLDWVPRAVDTMRVLDWRTGQYGDASNSLLAGVRRVPAAHTVTIGSGVHKLARYWHPSRIGVNHGMTMEQAAQGVRDRFMQAVEARLRSHGPVAAHLSGGLDSSSVVAAMRHLQPGRRVKAYTMTFEQADHPHEIDFARQVAQQGQVDLHEVGSDDHGPWWRVEDRVKWANGPLISLQSSFVMGLMAQAASRGERVMLDGSEGDDVIGHGDYLLVNHLRRLRFGAARAYARDLQARYGGTARRRLLVFGVRPMVQSLWTRWWLHRASQGRGALAHETPSGGPVGPGLGAVLRRRMWENKVRLTQNVKSDESARVANFSNPIFDELGIFLDHQYAGVGMEHRSPFFDRRLVEFCLTVPSRHRVAGDQTRVFFRRAMEDLLPPAVAWRPTKTRFDPVANHRMRDIPDHVNKTELQTWHWPLMPDLFSSRLQGDPRTLLRKHVLRESLARVDRAQAN